MDSRLIPLVLAAGWLLVTLGVWGATGRPWWLWPLSVGAGLLVVGAAYGWALAVQVRRQAAHDATHPASPKGMPAPWPSEVRT